MGPLSKPGRIDFNQLPLGEIAMILRRLGQITLQTALNATPRPNLTQILSPVDLRVLRTAPIWPVPLRRRIGRLRYLSNHTETALTKPLRRAVDGFYRSDGWRLRIREMLTMGTGGAQGQIIPNDFWPLVGHMAWNDLNFKRWAQSRISQHLSQNPRFAGQNPTITLTPQTFWSLIALCDAKSASLLKADSRRRFRLANRLIEEARLQTVSHHWAGFWDQWLLDRAIASWPEAVNNPKDPLIRVFRKLPIIESWPKKKQRRRFKPFPTHIFRSLILFFDRLQRPVRPLRLWSDGFPIDLCHPDWFELIPEPLKSQYLPELPQREPENPHV